MSIRVESVMEMPGALSSEVEKSARLGGLPTSDVTDAADEFAFGEMLGEIAADAKPIVADPVGWDSIARCESSRCFRSFSQTERIPSVNFKDAIRVSHEDAGIVSADSLGQVNRNPAGTVHRVIWRLILSLNRGRIVQPCIRDKPLRRNGRDQGVDVTVAPERMRAAIGAIARFD